MPSPNTAKTSWSDWWPSWTTQGLGVAFVLSRNGVCWGLYLKHTWPFHGHILIRCSQYAISVLIFNVCAYMLLAITLRHFRRNRCSTSFGEMYVPFDLNKSAWQVREILNASWPFGSRLLQLVLESESQGLSVCIELQCFQLLILHL